MTGIVVVSHSPALAHAAVEFALAMAGDTPPPVRIAAGTPDGSIGTDAVAIAAAIDEVADKDGALVVMDLGSAVLSAELALELITTTAPVRLSPAPFVEGLLSAVVVASAGAGLDDVQRECLNALEAKRTQLEGHQPGPAPAVEAPPSAAPAFDAVVRNPSGLHARPAATFVKTAGRFDAHVEVTDLDAGGPPVSAGSLVSLMALGVRQGTRIRVSASGPEADAALQTLRELVESGFGET